MSGCTTRQTGHSLHNAYPANCSPFFCLCLDLGCWFTHLLMAIRAFWILHELKSVSLDLSRKIRILVSMPATLLWHAGISASSCWAFLNVCLTSSCGECRVGGKFVLQLQFLWGCSLFLVGAYPWRGPIALIMFIDMVCLITLYVLQIDLEAGACWAAGLSPGSAPSTNIAYPSTPYICIDSICLGFV